MAYQSSTIISNTTPTPTMQNSTNNNNNNNNTVEIGHSAIRIVNIYDESTVRQLKRQQPCQQPCQQKRQQPCQLMNLYCSLEYDLVHLI